MSLCKASSGLKLNNSINVDGIFIAEYMPKANAECVKVYLYGLWLCSNGTEVDNNLSHFSSVLGITEQDVISAFTFWQEAGLVQIIETNPIEIVYLPTKSNYFKVKKYSKEKYENFNASVQALIDGRMITPNEFTEYYAFLEYSKMEQQALIMIIKYCINIKGNNVGYPYILTVAKNWAQEGVITAEKVEEKLKEEEKNTSAVSTILSALGSKRTPTYQEFDMFKNWTISLGFSIETIMHVAKKCKKGGINLLNNLLNTYFNNKLFSAEQIDNFEERKQSLYQLARNITKKIGLYYENVDSIIETYLSDWLFLGFTEDVLLDIASYCFKRGIRTLEGMANTISSLYKKGIVTKQSLVCYLQEIREQDSKIKELLETLGQNRSVTQFDRDMYKTWIYTWNISADLLTYAASISSGKLNAMQYLNKVLSTYFTNKITSVEQAKKQIAPAAVSVSKTNAAAIKTAEWSDDEIKTLFDNLTEL